MPWMFRSCGSFQESNFTTLQPPTSLLTLIRSGATLAATLDLVSHDLISLYFRLRVVPHFSSGIVEQVKLNASARENHPTREKATRGVSPCLAWSDFHVRSLFARSTIPEEKWGTSRSLLVF